MLTMEKFEEAYNTVQKVVNQTKLIYSEFFSEQSGNKVYLKPENLQVTGAYKIRGAYYKISTLSDDERKKDWLLRLREIMPREWHLLQRHMVLGLPLLCPPQRH